jgi:hypothetical protein
MYQDNKIVAFLKENHVQKRSILIVRKKKRKRKRKRKYRIHKSKPYKKKGALQVR